MPSHASYCILGADGTLAEENSAKTYPLYSITKTIIATLLVRSRIDLNRRVSDWISTDLFPHGSRVSLHHLLTHTSGIPDYGALPAYQRSVAKGGPAWSDETFADATLRQPLACEPGTAFSYSNPNYWLLKQVLEQETGTAFADLVGQLAERLHLGSFAVASGLFSPTLPNYDAGWVWHGLVLSNARDAATFMRNPEIKTLARDPVPVPHAGPLYPQAAYGHGVMTDRALTLYGHNGAGPGYSAASFHFPDPNVTVAVLMPHEGPGDRAYMVLRDLAAAHHLPLPRE